MSAASFSRRAVPAELPAMLPAALGPSRSTQILRLRMPAVLAHQLGALPVVPLGVRARPVPVVPPHLHVHEDAENVLPTAPAVAALQDVPDPVLRPLGLLQDDVRVVIIARLDLTEDDVPHLERRLSLLERAVPRSCCYSLYGVEPTRVVALDEGPHRISRGRVEDAAPALQELTEQLVPLVPELELELPLDIIMAAARHDRPIGHEHRNRFVRVSQHEVRGFPTRKELHGLLKLLFGQGKGPRLFALGCCS